MRFQCIRWPNSKVFFTSLVLSESAKCWLAWENMKAAAAAAHCARVTHVCTRFRHRTRTRGLTMANGQWALGIGHWALGTGRWATASTIIAIAFWALLIANGHECFALNEVHEIAFYSKIEVFHARS